MQSTPAPTGVEPSEAVPSTGAYEAVVPGGIAEPGSEASGPSQASLPPSEPAPSMPVLPTQAATQPATQPIEYPTEPPKATDPPPATDPPAPTEAVDDPAVAKDHRIIAAARLPDAMPEIEIDVVFCTLYDSSGNIVGSNSLYSSEKMAEIVSFNPDGSFELTYDPDEKGLTIESGQYEYVFYGFLEIELCRGTVWY